MPVAPNDHKEYSDEIRDLFSRGPGWVLRWGTWFFLVLVVGLISGAWMIRYPDDISGRIMITPVMPSAKVVTERGGVIRRIHIGDSVRVREGQKLMAFRDPLTEEQLRALDTLLQGLVSRLNDPRSLEVVRFPEELALGQAQDHLNGLKQSVEELLRTCRFSFFWEEQARLREEVAHYGEMIGIVRAQARLAEKNLARAREKFLSDSVLWREAVISRVEFFQREEAFHAREQELKEHHRSLQRLLITRSSLERELLDRIRQRKIKIRQLREEIRSGAANLQRYIREWKRENLLTAPVNGHLVFLKKLSEGEYLEKGVALFAILRDRDSLEGTMTLPAKGMGKVRVGQPVRIRLDQYPAREYGPLPGRVSKIRPVPLEGKYHIKVHLPQGLRTHYGKPLPFRPEMEGTASVITEERSLAGRMFFRVRGMME